MSVFTIKELRSSGGQTTSLQRPALMEPEEDPLGQSGVVVEEKLSAGIRCEEVLLMNEAYQNISFTGEMEVDDGAKRKEDEIVALLDVPSDLPRAAVDRVHDPEVSAPLMNVYSEEINSRGRGVLTRPGEYECIPLVSIAHSMKGAEAGSGAAKAHPVNTPEEVIEDFCFQLLGQFAFPEPAVDAAILLEDEAVVAATFARLFGDPAPEKRSEEDEVDEEATDPLTEHR